MELTLNFLLLFLLNISIGVTFLSPITNVTSLCSEYGQVEHAMISTTVENLLMEDISQQQTVHIHCAVGYDLEGPPKIPCVNGEWEQTVRPRCLARCDRPPHISNGRYQIDGNQSDGIYKKGALVIYSCKEGYQLTPPESHYRVCEKGIWTGANATCVRTEKILGCKPTKDILNGYYVHETPGDYDGVYSAGQRLHFSCKTGYVLIGPLIQQCLDDGTWSPKRPPLCLPDANESTDDYPCSSAPTVPHALTSVVQGFQSLETALPGTEVEIKCTAKYRNARNPCQSTRLKCTNGRWVGMLPNCVLARECSSPPVVAHGSPFDLNPETGRIRYPINAQISYQCLPGFELQGNYILTCSAGGCWTPMNPPACKLNSHYFLEVNGGGPMLISLATGAGVLLLLLIIWLAIVCRRRKPLSRAVPLPPPVPRPDLADHAALLHHPDRLALIAFADGIQVGQSVLPTYEEAVRDRGPGVVSSRFTRPHWPSLAHRRNRNSPDIVHVTRQGSFVSHSNSTRSGGDPMGSTDTMIASEGSTAVTLDTASSHSGSQSASCRAHCGSLASFDTSSVHNTEGVPLLEESELEEIQGDTRSLAMENRSMADDGSFKFNINSLDLA